MGRLFDSVATKAEHHADLRAREEDLTPRGVVWAVLQHLVLELKREAPRTILDVCAGYGVWSSEAGRLWPMAKITAVELDGRKEDALGRWANEVVIGDWTEALRCRQYDLAIGNPHFSALTHEDPSQSMPARLLERARWVLLFHQEQSFQKSTAGCRIWREYPPAAVFAVPGSVRFRVGENPETGKRYGADSRCYQATLWKRGHAGPAKLRMLPWLTSEARRWTVQPGAEVDA